MKKLFLLFLFTITVSLCQAQDFDFGQFKLEELDMPRYAKDTSAHAVVLREFGKTWLSSGERTPLTHEYHVRIKIFDNEAFEEYGNISIPIYKIDNDRFEEVSDIKAVTYYKDESGSVRKAELDPKNIFHVKQNRYYDEIKFAMPNLKKGCIIEYSYQLQTPRWWLFKDWKLQDYIPKIYSEYEAHIPAVFTFNVSLRGGYKLTKVNSELERECFSPGGGVKCDCSKITYIMTDIPAFVPEAHMTSPKNYLAAINFELSEYVNLDNGAKIKVAKEWKDIDYELKHSAEFGSQLKRTELMKDRSQSIIAGITDPLSKAKAIYQWLQKNYKFNGFIGIGSDDGIRKALNSHSGSVADINLSLVAALNSAGINTEAVLLSTRSNGMINKLYPVESDFNYVVAKANIGDKSYLLDATDPLLPFGLLPIQCINDQGRVMSLDKPSYWIDMVASERQTRTYAFDLTLGDDGKIRGTMSCYSKGYEAYNKRKDIKKFNSTDEYVEDMDNKLKKLKIIKSEIMNVDSLDQPLIEKYEIELNAYDDLNKNRLAFNPFFYDRISSNPFKLAERTYPVDWGAPSEDRFIVMMHLPQQYSLEALPQNIALALPEQGGRFLVNYGPSEDGFTCSYSIQFNHTIYSSQEYPYLKELFNKIVQTENTEVVFKKK